MFNYGEMSSVV